MKKKQFITLSLLTVALVLSSVAMAQGNGPGGQKGCCQAGCYVDKNGDGVCDNFKDANNDGKCDNCPCPAPCKQYCGGQCQGKCCGNFVDANNDGRCDNCPCPPPCGKGKCVRKGCPISN